MEFLGAEGTDRSFDHQIVVHVQDYTKASGFHACDRRHQNVARGPLHHVLGKGAVPAAYVFPLTASVILERHVGRITLEPRGHQVRIGISDRASRRQREVQIVGFEMGRDRNRRRADIDRLSGLDRDPNTAREVVPELHDPRMRPTPLLDVSLDLEVGTLVDDLFPPGSDRAAKAGRKIADLAGLAIDSGDGVELLTQHSVRSNSR